MSAEPAGVPHLRVVECADCERKDRQVAAMQIDLDNLDIDLRAKRRKISWLENEAAEHRREHPDYATALEIFEYWQTKCRPKARVFGAAREKAVLARLTDLKPGTDEKAYPPRYICEAVVGAVVEPYIDRKTGKRYDDLELICRTPEKLEDFHDRYDRWKATA